jgi:hypothetical protein
VINLLRDNRILLVEAFKMVLVLVLVLVMVMVWS